MNPSSDPLQGYAVHFTRGSRPDRVAGARTRTPTRPSFGELLRWLDDIDETGFRTSLSILWERFVLPTDYPMGVGAVVPELTDVHRSACFSESPLDDLARLIKTRSVYGVGFPQSFLQSRGGDRVIYVDEGSAQAEQWVLDVAARRAAGVRPSDAFWKRTPVVDVVSPSDDTRWEKEWRVPGGLRFEPDDVAFVFLPEEFHDNARRFFAEHQQGHTGPAYMGRYLDPRWDRARTVAALSAPVPAPRCAPSSVWKPPPSPFARPR